MNKFLLKIATGFIVFNYGVSICMLRKVEKRAEKIVRYSKLNISQAPKTNFPKIKDGNDFCVEIPRDNFFSQLPKELRLQCCPEGEDMWVRATMRPALNDNIQAFQWHMRLEDRKNLSSTCKSLREIMWFEDVNFRKHIQKNKERHPMPVSAIKKAYERGLEEGANSMQVLPYSNHLQDSLGDYQSTQTCILQ